MKLASNFHRTNQKLFIATIPVLWPKLQQQRAKNEGCQKSGTTSIACLSGRSRLRKGLVTPTVPNNTKQFQPSSCVSPRTPKITLTRRRSQIQYNRLLILIMGDSRRFNGSPKARKFRSSRACNFIKAWWATLMTNPSGELFLWYRPALQRDECKGITAQNAKQPPGSNNLKHESGI